MNLVLTMELTRDGSTALSLNFQGRIQIILEKKLFDPINNYFDWTCQKGIESLRDYLISNDSGNFDVRLPFTPRHKLTVAKSSSIEPVTTQRNESGFIGRVVFNKRATSEDHFQETRHVRFTLPDDVVYDAGDVLNVKPRNPPHLVKLAIEALPWDPTATGTCFSSLSEINIHLFSFRKGVLSTRFWS